MAKISKTEKLITLHLGGKRVKGTLPKKIKEIKISYSPNFKYYDFDTWRLKKLQELRAKGLQHFNNIAERKAVVRRDNYYQDKDIAFRDILKKQVKGRYTRIRKEHLKQLRKLESVKIAQYVKELHFTKEQAKVMVFARSEAGILKKTRTDLYYQTARVRINKDTIYDKKEKKSYTKAQYAKKVKIMEYWEMVYFLSDFHNMPIDLVRELLKKYGEDYFSFLSPLKRKSPKIKEETEE